jgi:soluble lytic murein transglycosylase
MRRMLLAACLCLAVAPARAQPTAPPSIPGLLAARQFDAAAALAAQDADPVAGKLVAYLRAIAPGAASLTQIEAFQAQDPGWPQPATLATRRDAALAREPDDAVAAQSCLRLRPASAPALARCAEALGQSDPSAAADAARAAWIAAAPDPAWDAAFLRHWGSIIDPATRWARFARLAWSNPAAAAPLIAGLDKADRPRAEAWVALHRDSPEAASLLARVPDAQRDPGLFLEQARWLRRGNRDPAAFALWQSGGSQAEQAAEDAHHSAFWAERNLLARRLLRDGEAADAYVLVAGAATTAPADTADAAFLSGWIALRRLSEPARAAGQFAALSMLSGSALTQSRAHYWLSRAAAALGDPAAARREALAAAAYPTTFYGQLAAIAAGERGAALARRIVAEASPVWTEQDAAAFAQRDLVRAAIYLVSWGEPGRASAFLLRLAEQGSPADLALTARTATLLGLPQTGVAVARLAGRQGIALVQAGWPLDPIVSQQGKVDPALVLAVIRQESSFDPDATSPAGARGLMQLMPAQAQASGRALGLPVTPAALSDDPGLNVQLGSTFLHDLLGRFSGSLPLSIAAYNAGPLRVAEWLAQNGDPRGADADAMIDWIELIPFSETRNYVQRVIEGTTIYRARLGEKLEPLPWSTPS